MEKVQSDLMLFKLVYNYRRLIDFFGTKNISLLTTMKPAHIPYFMSIGHEGISNYNLLKEIKVTRQGVSKAIKELENQGMVYTCRNKSDARSIMLFLTKEGENLYKILGEVFGSITSDYINLLGEKNYKQLLESLTAIIKYHEDSEDTKI